MLADDAARQVGQHRYQGHASFKNDFIASGKKGQCFGFDLQATQAGWYQKRGGVRQYPATPAPPSENVSAFHQLCAAALGQQVRSAADKVLTGQIGVDPRLAGKFGQQAVQFAGAGGDAVDYEQMGDGSFDHSEIGSPERLGQAPRQKNSDYGMVGDVGQLWGN